ncbi:hypothetical protein PIB30_060635 [Stylosanthes scabra]|uniref:NB-ARC domain-containing protein n=1 Tax=Stylosanthes scabra TaxID=79078 RepID=A0ABU6QL84_9FABA|nr:hypothetical protein [Stylosanthes scabra]
MKSRKTYSYTERSLFRYRNWYVVCDLRLKANGGTTKMSKVRGFFSISLNPIAFRAKLAHKIDNIQKDFNVVAKDMSKLNLNRSLVILQPDKSTWRETSSFVFQSEIIGREENKSDILNLLKQIQPNHNVSLVVVVGMGGLGKTALAQAQKMFQKYMWVCVSEDFEVKTILKMILESLKKDAGGDSLEALQQKLQEEVNGQKYLLVLDDVWNEDHLKWRWSNLRTQLMCGGQGSKILVTTRSKLEKKLQTSVKEYRWQSKQLEAFYEQGLTKLISGRIF